MTLEEKFLNKLATGFNMTCQQIADYAQPSMDYINDTVGVDLTYKEVSHDEIVFETDDAKFVVQNDLITVVIVYDREELDGTRFSTFNIKNTGDVDRALSKFFYACKREEEKNSQKVVG